jgi:tRNA(Ile)-lysidine synthase
MWSPSPVWPEGRGLFLLRPLLSVRREAIRAALAEAGESWIEDPSNVDLRYARSRVRASGVQPPLVADTVGPLTLVERASDMAGIITIARSDLQAAPPEPVRRFVGLACVSAGGGERLPLTARVVRAADALRGPDPFVATLAGARIEADSATVSIFREAGEAARGGLAPVCGPGVWDGRFEVAAGWEVRQLAGVAAQLGPGDREVLRGMPASARGAMPVRLAEDGGVALAALTSLVGPRLRAAAGLVQREPD